MFRDLARYIPLALQVSAKLLRRRSVHPMSIPLDHDVAALGDESDRSLRILDTSYLALLMALDSERCERAADYTKKVLVRSIKLI